MAKKSSEPKKKQTVRQKAEQHSKASDKPRRLRAKASSAKKPARAVFHAGKKEFYIPLPDNKFGKFLNKPRHIIPAYFRESWKELRLVTWPNRKETTKLSTAVVLFAVIFAFMIAAIDYGLDKLFRQLIL